MASAHRYTKIDIIMLSIGILHMVSCCYSICPNSTMQRTVCIMVIGCIYITARKFFNSEKTADVCFSIIGVCMLIAVTLAIYTFCIFRQNILDAGFHDTYHCRFLYKPLGYVNNAWAEISVVIFGFSLLVRRISCILMFLATCSVLLTFSRGAYLSLAVIIVSLIAAIPKQRIKILSISIAAIVIVGCCCTKEMLITIQPQNNYSQQKSAEWRIKTSISSFTRFKERPVLGFGNGSYTLATDEGNLDNFTSFAPNIFTQLLIENGITGVLIYALLCICMIINIYTNRHKIKYRIIVCILLAVMTKELTQATLLSMPSLCSVIVIMIAYMQGGEKHHVIGGKQYFVAILPIMLISCAVMIFKTKNKHKNIPIVIKHGIKMASQKNMYLNELSQTKIAIQQAIRLSPYDDNIRYILAELYIKEGKYKEAQNILIYLRHRSPGNAIYAFTSGTVMHILGQDNKAICLWSNAIILYPRLLYTQEFETVINEYPNSLPQIKRNVYAHFGNKPLIPVEYAHWGFILKYFGEEQLARAFLKDAITEVPNFAVPWYLLGDKKKYNLLRKGAFTDGITFNATQNAIPNTVMGIFENTYKPRFYTWYI